MHTVALAARPQCGQRHAPTDGAHTVGPVSLCGWLLHYDLLKDEWVLFCFHFWHSHTSICPGSTTVSSVVASSEPTPHPYFTPESTSGATNLEGHLFVPVQFRFLYRATVCVYRVREGLWACTPVFLQPAARFGSRQLDWRLECTGFGPIRSQ